MQREVGLKQELEMVVKLHESDLSHKQQGLVALREQLDNVKTINADLYLKLQVRLFKLFVELVNLKAATKNKSELYAFLPFVRIAVSLLIFAMNFFG